MKVLIYLAIIPTQTFTKQQFVMLAYTILLFSSNLVDFLR